MSQKKRILVAAGGTGGHLFPAIAVVEKLIELNPNIEPIFVGRQDKIEAKIVPAKGFEFIPMDISAAPSPFSVSVLSYVLKMQKAIKQIKRLIVNKNICATIATGAYISIPPGIASKRKKIPLYLMESNVNTGKAIRYLSNSAYKIFTSFEETSNFVKKKNHSKIKCYGNPVRKDLLNLSDKITAREKLGLEADKFTLLVFGGSLGANSINSGIINKIENFGNENIQLIWQTGRNHEFTNSIPDNIIKTDFIDDMATAYAACDMVISRSGATTIAELAVVGKPAILVPYPYAANQEQFHNAQLLDEANASILINDNDIGENLYPVVRHFIKKEQRLDEMSSNIRKFAKPGAAEKIALDILKDIE